MYNSKSTLQLNESIFCPALLHPFFLFQSKCIWLIKNKWEKMNLIEIWCTLWQACHIIFLISNHVTLLNSIIHAITLLSPSGVNALGLPDNWLWRVGSVARKFYFLEVSAKEGFSLEWFPTLSKKKCSHSSISNAKVFPAKTFEKNPNPVVWTQVHTFQSRGARWDNKM